MKNVVAYVRVSTNKEDQINSLEAQKRYFEDYALAKGYNLIKIYADEGKSGTKIKARKAFRQMLEDSERGLFDILLVKDFSRFARNTIDSLTSLDTLKKNGVKVIFVAYGNMGLDETSDFTVAVLSAVAQVESQNTSTRVKLSKEANAKRGRVPNIVYGYDKTPGDYFNLSINEFEASVVRRIFDMYINDGHGALKIAHILNKEGLKTKRDCKWSQNAVSRILSNQIYSGRVVNGKEAVESITSNKRIKEDTKNWHITEKPELRIIEDGIFNKAQSILKSHHDAFHITGKRASNKHVFSTLIKCKHCGYSFRRFERTYVNTFVKWVCSGRNIHGVNSCCNDFVVDEKKLLALVREYFLGLLKDKPSVIKRIRKKVERIIDSQDNNKKSEKELEDELRKLKKDKKYYMDMLLSEVITMPELKEYVNPINERLELVENELRLVRHNIGKADVFEDLLNDTLKSIESIVDEDYFTNAMLKKVLAQIIIDKDGKTKFVLNLGGSLGLEETVQISDVLT